MAGHWKRKDAVWTEAGSVYSGGSAPCFLSLSPDASHLVVANYGDGSLGVVRLDPTNGTVLELSHIYRPARRSIDDAVDPERQDGPHAHCAVFWDNGRTIYHVDLGLDRVFRHDLAEGAIINSCIAFETPRGFGPRHLAFHPDGVHVLLLCELAPRLLLLRRDKYSLTLFDCVSTVPEPGFEENLGGHLAIDDAGTVYVTNRGHDSIVSFKIESCQANRRFDPLGELKN